MKKLLPVFLLSMLQAIVSCGTDAPEIPSEEIEAISSGLTKPIVVKGQEVEKFSIAERMKYHKVPGLSMAVMRNGKLHWAKAWGWANTDDSTIVNAKTLFQAGSISKPVAALAVLHLYQEGRLDLDRDVNTYLKDWKVEENEFTKDKKVTLRRLLTHTAGMTVHGFPGYKQQDEFPDITTVLEGRGNTAPIFVDTPPDSIWRYSGGGYTVMEKVVEDVTGVPFEQYLQEQVLEPLGMHSSTYAQPLPEALHTQASAAYYSDGSIIEGYWHNYPEQAAAGLWTTPGDLAKYISEVQAVLQGAEPALLSKATLEQMLTRHKNDWGLGPSLAGEGDSLRFQHGGKNAGFTNDMIAFAHTGDAIIVMSNADNGGRLIREILRSASSYYGWGIAESREVELAKAGEYDLHQLEGTYRYVEQVPEIGNYDVDLLADGDKLLVIDSNNGERDTLRAMSAHKFIDLGDGDEVAITVEGDSIGFTWNYRFQFYKLK